MARIWKLKEHGITQSMISKWLECPQKAKLRYIDGVIPARITSQPLEFGNLVHRVLDVCYSTGDFDFRKVLEVYEEELMTGMASADTLQMYEDIMGNAESLLNAYFLHWSSDRKLQWLDSEHKFDFVHDVVSLNGKELPIRCRGKMDGVFMRAGKYWLLETKTKAQINDDKLIDALTIDFQTLMYLYALWQNTGVVPAGVLYNVLRRPSLRQGKKESRSEFCARVESDINAKPEHYFHRFEVAIVKDDLEQWASDFDSIIRIMYEWSCGRARWKSTKSCDLYSGCEYVPICTRGDYSNFSTIDTAFPELEG